MPKTTPVPESLKQRILELRSKNPGYSARKIAERFKLHHKTVSKILKGEPAAKASPAPVLAETSEVTGNTWTISLPKTRIRTLEELIKFCEVDLSIWKVDRFICNKWEVGAKNADDELVIRPLFQVKAFLSRILFDTTDEYVKDNAKLRSQLEKTKVQLRLEHVKPLNKGGAHLLCNLRPACGDCNRFKLQKWPFPTAAWCDPVREARAPFL